jgi:hypothetical protein
MGLEDIVEVIIYQDDTMAGIIKMRREYVAQLAIENGLESFFEDALCYYTCLDGPVFVIWGVLRGKTRIIGLTPSIEELKPESALRQAWEQHTSKHLRRQDVHNAILQATQQVLN